MIRTLTIIEGVNEKFSVKKADSSALLPIYVKNFYKNG
jgi:hypothetical protein